MFDKLEMKVLFRFTRILALGIVLLLLGGIVVGSITVLRQWADTPSERVDPKEVISSLQPSEPGTKGKQSMEATAPKKGPLDSITLHSTLKELFSEPGNRHILANILEDVPEDQRQAYVDNMEDVAEAAKSQHIGVAEAINTYVRIKREKVASAAVHREIFSQYRLVAAASAASALLLIGMFSLVLVLLAIERNTRLPR